MRITLIITGGIAAYKSLELIRLWRKAGCAVRPVLTAAAEEFVTPLSVEAIARAPVYRHLFQPGLESGIGHIQFTREADAIVVAPASAHFLARVSLGLADDLATTMLLAGHVPLFMAPAMNPLMWRAPPTQEHVARLRQRGVTFIGPDEGEMACGETGEGRMVEPEEIVAAVLSSSVPVLSGENPGAGSLLGRKIVITGGATREPIDPVRFMSNHSSGQQAVAVAEAAMSQGAQVTLVHGPMSVQPPQGCRAVAVQTAEQMWHEAKSHAEADVFIAAAAVADWRPEFQQQKIKKNLKNNEKNHDDLVLKLTPTRDILASIAACSPRPGLVVGFAVETQDDVMKGLALARAKCWRKGCDMLLFNPVNQINPAFGCSHNHLHFLHRPKGSRQAKDIVAEDWGRQTKTRHAARLVERIGQFFADTP